MFERFTDRARRAVVLAQEEARGLGHTYIGTEHLLLGLLREDEGLAAKALTSLQITANTVSEEIGRRVGRGSAEPRGHIAFTPRAKKVLELSLREALRLGHNYIGTEHVLLGLAREGEGVAAQVLLTRVDGGLEKVIETLAALMDDPRITRAISAAGREARRRMGIDITPGNDEVRKRLEAIEARLSVIEQLLRSQRGEEEVS